MLPAMEERFFTNQPIDSCDYPQAISLMQAIMTGKARGVEGSGNEKVSFGDFRASRDRVFFQHIQYLISFQAAQISLTNFITQPEPDGLKIKLFGINSRYTEAENNMQYLLESLNLKDLYTVQKREFAPFYEQHIEIADVLRKNDRSGFDKIMHRISCNPAPNVFQLFALMIKKIENKIPHYVP